VPFNHPDENSAKSYRLTDGVMEAWKARCAKLGQEERQKFESGSCRGLAEYLAELARVCQEHRDESRAFQFVDWFEPLYTAVELFMPAAKVFIQADPSPGSLVLGGIVAALQATQRLREYHKLTVQMLARMGRKAHILQAYETVVYKTDDLIQKALVEVYGDILDFCQNAVKLVSKNRKTIIKVKGYMMSVFKDFDAQLGSFVQAFDTHIDELEALGRLRDKKRLKDLHDSLNTRYAATSEASGDNKEQLQRLGAAIDMLVKRNREIQIQEEQQSKEKHRAALLDWLSSMNFLASYDRRCGEHLDGTGTWMLQSEAYTNWKSGDKSDLLWVRGKPGCGKSVLAAVVVTDLKLEMEPDTALGYAFCQRDEESFQDPIAIYGALARQVSEQVSGTSSTLEMECRASHSNAKPSQRAIRLIMASAVKELKRTYLVVDALDECKDEDQLAQELRDLVDNAGLPTVKVIVFSRTEYSIEQHLGGFKQVEPDQGANEQDLKAYIRSLFPDTKDKKSANAEIRKQCFLKADGMFLWVRLLAKNLSKSPLPGKEKVNLIKNIPPGLDHIYDRILDGICSQTEYCKATAFQVLLWVMFAWRPLSRTEMLDAVADYADAKKLRDATKYDKAEHLVAICANLVFIDRDGCFRLCHESVRNYLEKPRLDPHPLSDFQKQKQHAHQRLAEICLNYMLLEDFERGPALSLDGLIKFAARKPLVDYASNWDLHVNKENFSALRDLIIKCVNSQPRRELSMQFSLLDWDNVADKLWKYGGTSNPLHLLAITGLKKMAEEIPDVASLALKPDGSGKTPLEYAMERQHHDMAFWLIELISNVPSEPLSVAQTLPLVHKAAKHGWDDVLEYLLSRNKDLANLKMSHDGETPLGLACSSGKREAAETLIRHGASVNLEDGKGESPLIMATSYGHPGIVPILLAHGAEPNCCDPLGWSPLHYAADLGSADMVTALLEKNANPLSSGPDGKRRPPLVIAAFRNHVEAIKAFYRWDPRLVTEAKPLNGWAPIHGAAYYNSSKSLEYLLSEPRSPRDTLTDDDEKETALNIAADLGFIESVKALVNAGCDPSIPDAKGRNAIHAAARSGKLQVVKYILKSQLPHTLGPLVNRRDNNGETPLHSAVFGENPEIVTLLLEHGSNPIETEGDTKVATSSPLHRAAERGLSAIAAELLKRTKDANLRNSEGEVPLHLAAKGGKLQFIVQFLQDAASLGLEVDINAKSNENDTALRLALANDAKELAEFLLQQGAISVGHSSGSYPIHHAAWRGYDSIVKTLMTHDGLLERGYFGRTPLHCAVVQGHLSTVKLLASASADVLNAPDEQNNTPIYTAIASRYLEVAHYLLDLGVDTSGTDDRGNGLLHMAVCIPDLPLCNRLLRAGYQGDQPNHFGETPFHFAADVGSVEIADALVAAGFNGVHSLSLLGCHPVIYAAQSGKMEMLRKLTALGGTSWPPDDFGRNAAHSAAEKSHPEVIWFLRSCGVDIMHADAEGYTPLMTAASNGNAALLSSLLWGLDIRPPTVDQRSRFTDQTALMLAAKEGRSQCVRLLLAAGADPYLRDCFGISAIEYASRHRPSLREMHKADYLRAPDDYTELRRNTLFQLIRRLGESILQQTPAGVGGVLYPRVSRIWDLSCALILFGDYEAAKAPLIELLWPPKLGIVELNYKCCVCEGEKMAGDKYICQTCLEWTFMCKACHDDFEEAKGKTPESLKEMLELEEKLRPVRLAALDEPSLYNLVFAMRHFVAGCDWTDKTWEKYELWEQKYNSSKRFSKDLRPGQDFLRIVMDAAKSVPVAGTDLPEFRKTAAQLQTKYKDFRSRHGWIKDTVDFHCENHNFMLITEQEAKDAKAGLDVIGPEGRLSVSYLEGLIKKYSDSAAAAGISSKATGPPALYRHGSSGHEAGRARDDPRLDRQWAPKRSFTLAVRQPLKRPTTGASVKPPAIKTDLDITPSSPSPISREFRLRKARTLPVDLDTDLTEVLLTPVRDKFGPLSEKKGTDVITQTPNTTLAVLGPLTDLNYSAPASGISSGGLTNIASTDAATSASHAGSSTLEPPAPSSQGKHTNFINISAENNEANRASMSAISLRFMLNNLANGNLLQAFSTNLELVFALHMTASMVPGFVDTYFATRQDEHELAKEAEAASRSEEEEESSGSGEKDGDSDEGSEEGDNDDDDE